jgi:hypothetical protein
LILVSMAVCPPLPQAAPRYSPWSAPVNLGAPINSAFADTGARLSKDGLSLYFASDRPCGEADAVLDFNLWVARRRAAEAPWPEPRCLALNADARVTGDRPYQDREPELSRDQHWLYFVSDRPGSLGPAVPAGGDIWASWRADVHDDHGWTEPFNLAGLNTTAGERTPQYFENDEGGPPQLFFATTRSGFLDVWVIDLASGLPTGEPRRVDEVNTDDQLDAGGAITHDGLEMIVFRGRPGIGIFLDLFSSTRRDTQAAWSTPVNLGPTVNSAANDQEPAISSRRDTLFFASNRTGSTLGANGQPTLDIWMAVRTRERASVQVTVAPHP